MVHDDKKRWTGSILGVFSSAMVVMTDSISGQELLGDWSQKGKSGRLKGETEISVCI